MDDEEPIRRALRRLLCSSGLDVVTFASGQEFLDWLPGAKPDCLILDLHMPAMTGFEVQTALARAHGSLPVVVITGYDTAESRDRVMANGAAAYLRKPVDEEVLLGAAIGATPAPGR